MPDVPDGAIHEGEPPVVPNKWLAETTTRTQACCYLSTPEHVRSFVGTFIYIYTDKGELTLTGDCLRFTGKNQTHIEIALDAITDISIGHYSRIAKPVRLDYLAVTYHKNRTERILLFTPTESWSTPIWETNKIVTEWVEALQQGWKNCMERGNSGDGVPTVQRFESHQDATHAGEPPLRSHLAATTTMRVRATGSGRIVGWSELKEGRLVDASRIGRLLLTTTLTDVITDLCSLAESLDGGYEIVMIVPNGFTTASLDMKLVGLGFEIVCSRRLVRGWFPLNPIAAEFGSNYDVVVTIGGESAKAKAAIAELLRSRYSCEE